MLKKHKENPILLPDESIKNEGFGVLNPGAWYENGKFYLLYRAAGEAPDYKICLGLATSEDGYNFERVSPGESVFYPLEGSYDGGCIEDARVVKMSDGWCYVTYACRPFAPGPYWEEGGKPWGAPNDKPGEFNNMTLSALARTKDFLEYERLWPLVGGGDIDDRDVILFPEKVEGQYLLMRRPAEWFGSGYPNEVPCIWLSYSDDMKSWGNDKVLAQAEFAWEKKKIGGGPPPIKTEYGWFIIHHGVDADHVYRAGMMMLDLNDPTKVIARHSEPILEPEETFEKEGVFPNVVFPTGNVLVDDTIYVYYGGADKVCCVATANFADLVDELMKYSK